MEKRVLLIDDDPLFIRALSATLTNQVELRVVSIADEALRISAEWRPNLVLLDPHLAPGDSFSVLDKLSQTRCEHQISVICLVRGAGSMTRIRRFGGTVFGTLKRTSSRDQIEQAIALALEFQETIAA